MIKLFGNSKAILVFNTVYVLFIRPIITGNEVNMQCKNVQID
ncbi:hypothetical protein PAUR_b1316 [Pseudoalteromonas aurantia 208]|uniref:Orphan protein n=1 Tax=Pseudoalteromonas aurantia 208 TaxID=1314867 RepID=A0ABR9EJF1_9GAMM|nr:hypothetical protein [Pseudoalteromonas aurantia 208]